MGLNRVWKNLDLNMAFMNWCQIECPIFKTPQLFQVPKKFCKTQAKAHKLVERVRGLWGCGTGVPSVQLSWPCYAMLSWHGQGLAMRKGGLGSITEENEELSFMQWEMIEWTNPSTIWHHGHQSMMNLSSLVDHLILAECLGLKVSQIQSWRTPKMARNFRRFWQIRNIP